MFGRRSLPLLALALAAALNGSADTPSPATHRTVAALAATGSVPKSLGQREQEALGRMAGQMVLVGFEGAEPADSSVQAVRAQLANGTIGGVVLFPENIRSASQLRSLTSFLSASEAKLTPLIAVDQEGGVVQRLGHHNGHTDFPAAETVGRDPKLSTPDAAERLYGRMAQELAKAGFNVNFGPVVDLAINPWNRVIVKRNRSYGSDPEAVTKLARAFVAAHRKANILTSAKHFPGHGSSLGDSHKVLPDLTRTWRDVELRPYTDLAKAKMLDMVMVGHLYHPRFSDGDKLPASLSSRAIAALRDKKQIGFKGVVVSDDMEMGAVWDPHSIDENVVKAVNAGVDLLIFSNVKSRDPELGVKIRDVLVAAVRDGRISHVRLAEAYGRIVRMKRRLLNRNLAARGESGPGIIPAKVRSR
jgi:beta-N-acetylhexosaminidase